MTSRVVGYFYVTLCILMWTVSNVIVEHHISGAGYHSMAMVSVLGGIPSFLLWSFYAKSPPTYTREYLLKGLPMSLIALISSVTYNLSLGYKMMPTTTVVSSTATIFTLIFEIWLLKERVQLTTIVASVISFMGCAIVTLDAAEEPGVRDGQIMCIILSLISAAASGLFSVFVQLLDIKDAAFFLPCMSTALFTMSPFVLPILHATGVENFEHLPLAIFALILLNGSTGVVANYCQLASIKILSPVVVNVFLSLMIPLSIVVDSFFESKTRLSGLFVIGSVVVFLSAVLVASSPPGKSEPEERLPLTGSAVISERLTIRGDDEEDDVLIG